MFVQQEIKGNYVILSIKRDPVNSMNLDVWIELQETLDEFESNPKIRGIIFSSGLDRNIFTAGNDLMELYAPKTNAERYAKFWTLSNQFLANLYSSPLVTVSAINGACPAGGCALSLCCDYRVATEDATMGLNETALGIPVPQYWVRLLGTIVGPAVADKMAQFAQMIPAKQGLKMGLVDHVVPSRQVLVPAAEEIIKKLLLIPDPGKNITKLQYRNEFASILGDPDRLRQDSEMGWQMLSEPSTIKALDRVFANLSKPKSKM